jgi:hypothetical protein
MTVVGVLILCRAITGVAAMYLREALWGDSRLRWTQTADIC